MGGATAEPEATGMTREQQIALARLECGIDRFILASRLTRRTDEGVVGVASRYLPAARSVLLVAQPFLPRPLRILAWVVRMLPTGRR